MHWDDLRYFLAIVRSGSLRAAARELGVSQSTVSRRLAEMERQLEARLVSRTADELPLTAAGAELADMAQDLEAGFARIDRRLAGRDTHISGPLRVTCTDNMANNYLAPQLV